MEGGPENEKPPFTIETEQNEEGTYEMKASAEALELVTTIPDFENLDSAAQIEALTNLMEELQGDNENRHVVEALARRAYAIELYAKMQKLQDELDRIPTIDKKL